MENKETSQLYITLEQTEIADHEDHSNDCDDGCSPFCVCSCCSLTMNVPSTIFFSSNLTFNIEENISPFSSNFYPSSFSTSVWHPPKYS
jgi:hypothetical protein